MFWKIDSFFPFALERKGYGIHIKAVYLAGEGGYGAMAALWWVVLVSGTESRLERGVTGKHLPSPRAHLEEKKKCFVSAGLNPPAWATCSTIVLSVTFFILWCRRSTLPSSPNLLSPSPKPLPAKK